MTRKIIALVLSFGLLFQQAGLAAGLGELNIAGYLGQLHSAMTAEKFRPLHLRYFSYDTANNNFRIFLDKGDFMKGLLEKGLSPQGTVPNEKLKEEAQGLLKYFLIGVTLPDNCFWVNLRPDSPENIIDPYLYQTDMGKVFLEADLQLKKDTAKMTSPATPEGRAYWDKLYKKANELFGYENVTIPTLTRPWIVPGEIIIRETPESGYIYKANLKVMLEADYLKGLSPKGTVPEAATYQFKDPRMKALNVYSSQIIRETIIPKLTKEVNTSKRYAALRQAYYSLILSRWFKGKFRGKPGIYPALIDKKNLDGLISQGQWSKEEYFKQYQKSFKDGEYNFQEPVQTPFGQVIRSYFSGGLAMTLIPVGNGVSIDNGGAKLESVLDENPGVAGFASNAVHSKRGVGAVLSDTKRPLAPTSGPGWGPAGNNAGEGPGENTTRPAPASPTQRGPEANQAAIARALLDDAEARGIIDILVGPDSKPYSAEQYAKLIYDRAMAQPVGTQLFVPGSRHVIMAIERTEDGIALLESATYIATYSPDGSNAVHLRIPIRKLYELLSGLEANQAVSAPALGPGEPMPIPPAPASPAAAGRRPRTQPGKSPEDALLVIATSGRLQNLLGSQGYFTLEDYLAAYREVGAQLGLKPLADNPESTARRDLYYAPGSLVQQKLLDIKNPDARGVPYRFVLTLAAWSNAGMGVALEHLNAAGRFLEKGNTEEALHSYWFVLIQLGNLLSLSQSDLGQKVIKRRIDSVLELVKQVDPPETETEWVNFYINHAIFGPLMHDDAWKLVDRSMKSPFNLQLNPLDPTGRTGIHTFSEFQQWARGFLGMLEVVIDENRQRFDGSEITLIALKERIAKALPEVEAAQKKAVLEYFQVESPEEIKEKTPKYGEMAQEYAGVTAGELLAGGYRLSPAQAVVATAELVEVARKMSSHISPGLEFGYDYSVDTNDQALMRAARAQHIGYVAGVLHREFGLDEEKARVVLTEYFDNGCNNSILETRLGLTDKFLAENDWMFRGGVDEKGELKSKTDVFLNLPGVYAGKAALNFANALTGNQEQGRELLNRLLLHSAEEIEGLLQGKGEPQEVVLAVFAARAAQLGWLVSKLGQGIVEAHNPKKAAGSVKRWAPRNELITNFNKMVQDKGWKEVAKDIDQIRAWARHQGIFTPAPPPPASPAPAGQKVGQGEFSPGMVREGVVAGAARLDQTDRRDTPERLGGRGWEDTFGYGGLSDGSQNIITVIVEDHIAQPLRREKRNLSASEGWRLVYRDLAEVLPNLNVKERAMDNLDFVRSYPGRRRASGDLELDPILAYCEALGQVYQDFEFVVGEYEEGKFGIYRRPKTAQPGAPPAATARTTDGQGELTPETLGLSSPSAGTPVGGIDFRAMKIIAQPMGSCAGLNFTLPLVKNWESVDLDKEFKQIKLMVECGITPSGQRIKEFISVACKRKELDRRLNDVLACLVDVCRLQEEGLQDASPELRECLVIVDSGKFEFDKT